MLKVFYELLNSAINHCVLHVCFPPENMNSVVFIYSGYVPLTVNVVCYEWESDFYLYTHTDTLHSFLKKILLCVTHLLGQHGVLTVIS